MKGLPGMPNTVKKDLGKRSSKKLFEDKGVESSVR